MTASTSAFSLWVLSLVGAAAVVANRRVPVQGCGNWHLHAGHSARKPGAMPPGTIVWEEHLLVWERYAERYGRDQSAERMVERGGFAYDEAVELLGRPLETWCAR